MHRSFEKRRLLVAYNLFVRLVCKEVEDGGLKAMRSFIIMDIVSTIVRVLPYEEKGEVLVANESEEASFQSYTH